ncbi:histidine kinase [Streptomyces sp. NPDC005526]|uniref:sensor histidine kinase n=1 Tax=Streptomyces sp. NPDC005526 TaxID=3156885 RepID=UPI0033AFCCAB
MRRWIRLPWGMVSAGVPVVDVAAAVATLGLALAEVAGRGYGAVWLTAGAAVALAGAAAVGLRTRLPRVAVGLLCLMLLGSASLPRPTTPLWGFVMLLLVSFSAGAYLAGRMRAVAVLAILAATYPLQVLGADSTGDRLAGPVMIVGAGAVAGAVARRSRLQAERLAALTEMLRAERAEHARLAALAERARIARDVHDVVAHSVSLMVVQAGAALSLLPEDAPARQQLATVRATGREALRELHGLLAVLRDGTDADARVQPGMDELTELARSAGAEIQVSGTPRPLGPGPALTVFQVAREALTNARRHAPGAAVRVEVAYRTNAVSVTVADTGPGAPPGHNGYGISGMRERADLHGGQLTVGPHPSGGWQVQLWLPLPETCDTGPAPA